MAATHEQTSSRGWSIRVPRRDAVLVLAALAVGGGGGSAALRMLTGQPAGAQTIPQPPPQDPAITQLAAEVAEVKRVQRIQARNELLLCDLAARIAKQPNPCVEP